MYFQRLRDLREDMDLNQTQIAEHLPDYVEQKH